MSGLASHRRGMILGALALGLASPAAVAQPGAEADMSMGNPKARVTLIEYASVGCPHCALWAREVFPALKAKYIDTGKVRFILREMLTGNGELAAAGFLTARCAGPAKYFQVVEAVYAAQEKLEQEGAGPLRAIAKDAGLNDAQFEACLNDEKALAALEARSRLAGDVDKITGTPTFVIGDRKLEGDQSLADLEAAIAAASARH
jgi:protein-disulfide isomerase